MVKGEDSRDTVRNSRSFFIFRFIGIAGLKLNNPP